MRSVSGSYRTGAENKIRDVGVKILTNDDEAKTIPSDQILSISIQRSVSGGSFSIGNAPSDRLNAVIVGTEKLPKKTRITVYVNFDSSDWERLGRFYVDSCTRNGQRITVTAYDALSLAEKPVKFGGKTGLKALAFPCLMQEMLDYIVALRGMTCTFECQPFMVYEKPMKSETEYYTARELFGLIAACHGCNAKMDAEGKLTFREFGEVSANLTTGNVLDQMIDDGEPFTVRGVLFKRTDLISFYVDDVPGSTYDEEADGIVICNNPLATVQIAEYVWHKIGKLSYYGGSVKIRGAGILECGDVVSVGNLKYPTDSANYPFCITDISYSISREDGFNETLSSEVTRRSSTSGSGFDSSLSYTAGRGIEISGKEVRLKTAGKGVSIFDADQALGGVYIGNKQGLNVDYDGRLYLDVATPTEIGGIRIGDGLKGSSDKGRCSINIGKGMRFNSYNDYNPGANVYYGKSVSPNLGDGLKFDPSEDEEDPDYGKLHLNLGKGLEFGARKYEKKKDSEGNDTEDDDLTRYTSEVQLKLGAGMRFGANGELIAEGGKEYKAGENISISEDGTISANVKEYTAGENITISSDGKISATGGGAELAAGGGITIETDEETGKQTVSAAVGEGVRIENGKICTVPNIQNAVLITEADAEYLLHDFTQIEYNRGSQIGYAGPGNQIVVQGYLAYFNDTLGGNVYGSTYQYTNEQYETSLADKSRYFGMPEFKFYSKYYSEHYTGLRFEIKEATATRTTYILFATKETGEDQNIGGFSNYLNWSGAGLLLSWDTIYPPGYTDTPAGSFEFGCIKGNLHTITKGSATNPSQAYLRTPFYRETLYVPFASLAEYQAAVGLTYEPLTLTRVEDSPTVVSGKDIGEGVT